jgi:subtilisin-like proprotein convertase family protein
MMHEGNMLRRGGDEIPVEKTSDSFTAKLEEPDTTQRLRALDEVETVEPVTNSVVQVKVAAPGEAAAEDVRDDLMARLREDDGLVVHHEYYEGGAPQHRFRLLDEIIVRFSDGTGTARIGEILEQHGLVVKKEYTDLASTYLLVVTDAAGANPIKIANRLSELPEVEYAEPALVNELARFAFPVDEQFAAQWHLYSKGGAAPDIVRLADASVYEAWQVTKGARDIVVAVLDDGFALDSEDFLGDGKIVEAVDFRSGGTSPLPRGGDYHGTPCAGVAIAEENDLNCVGVAPRCAFMPVRFPLDAADPWLIEIFNHVSRRAHIASCSWGPPPANAPLHSAVRDTLTNLARSGGKDGRGLALVFAAGNYGAPLDDTVAYAVRWRGYDGTAWRMFAATGRIVNGFAAHPDTIAVAACNSLNRRSRYSNWGKPLDVAAPSNDFDPTTNSRLPGRGITTTDNEGAGRDFTPGKRYTHSFGGTSSATPLVSGAAALVKSANPALTALAIKGILQQTADKIEDDTIDPIYNLAKGTYVNGFSEWFGYGKVNASRAVQEAVRRLPVHNVLDRENRTAVDIPDGFPPGVTSAIEITESGVVAGVEVEIDITHPWIGDLQVSLVSPRGAEARLHRGTGGRKQDLRQTYSPASAPELAGMLGDAAQGHWLLRVADTARRDVGRLTFWRLRVTLADDRRVSVRSADAQLIPDNDPNGIRSELAVDRDGAVVEVAVGVDISHTWAGDLRVALFTPEGVEIVLDRPDGQRADGLRRRYDSTAVPELAQLGGDGVGARGVWGLRVADVASRDVGKLNSWQLDLTIA